MLEVVNNSRKSSLVINMPNILYQRLQRISVLTRRPVENIVLQTLTANVPSLPEDLSESMREILIELEKLGDEALWSVARGMISQEHQEQYSRLLEKNRQGTLSPTEQRQVDKLYNDANQHMLRKAYANVLLKWRGYKLPTLSELLH